MTTYRNTPTGTQTGQHRTEQEKHRDIIAKVCLDCYNHAEHPDDFQKSIRLIRHLLLTPSKTPALDEAYLDGITTALTLIKGENP